MYLVFVRHGKAEYGHDDYKRELTHEGRAALIEYYVHLEAQLRETFPYFDEMRVSVLTSPKLRALQTAELLAEQLGLEEVKATDSLMNYSLAAALKEARKTGSDLVFLVGHDPMCSVWVSELCQQDVSFRKGAAALLDYSRPHDALKPLIWYITPHQFL